MASKDKACRFDFVGLDGETSWILITDHFTGIKHRDTQISQLIGSATSLPSSYAPICSGKYVCMDQGSELFGNPYVRNLI